MLGKLPPKRVSSMTLSSHNLDGDDLNHYLCRMTNEVLKELFRYNLCTYFVLPMLKLNKFRFIAESNFVDSYLSYNGDFVLVKVLETLFFEHNLSLHPQFDGVYKDDEGYRYVRYRIPERFKPDVDLFQAGEYSKMSKASKDLIYRHSGLLYKELNPSGNVSTDIRLLALERSRVVREMWEDHLDVCISEDAELLSIPPFQSYVDLAELQDIVIQKEDSL